MLKRNVGLTQSHCSLNGSYLDQLMWFDDGFPNLTLSSVSEQSVLVIHIDFAQPLPLHIFPTMVGSHLPIEYSTLSLLPTRLPHKPVLHTSTWLSVLNVFSVLLKCLLLHVHSTGLGWLLHIMMLLKWILNVLPAKALHLVQPEHI